MNFLAVPESRIPVAQRADVAVTGGGPSGIAAAVAAAREGKSVLLIEKNGFCGGVLAMGLPIQGFDYSDGTPLVRGIAWEIYQRLVDAGGALPELIPCKLHNPYAIIDPHICRLVLDDLLEEAGVSVWNHASFCNTITKKTGSGETGIEALVAACKGGLMAFTADQFIDATGDGDAAASAGADYTTGRPKDGLMQSATLNFCLSGVDLETLGEAVRNNERDLFDTHELIEREDIINAKPHIMVGIRNLIADAGKRSGLDIPCDYASYITGIHPGTVIINMVHVHHAEGHTASGLSRAEQAGRKQIPVLVRLFREWVPGFRNAYISDIAPVIGIRESRHILGEYTLTYDDIKNGIFPEDTVTLGGYPIDIHNPEKGDVKLERVPPYGIPYRSMVPKGITNLLVTGRAISADHLASASSRLMAPCMGLGQAAGTAAALAVSSGRHPGSVTPDLLPALESRHAVLTCKRAGTNEN